MALEPFVPDAKSSRLPEKQVQEQGAGVCNHAQGTAHVLLCMRRGTGSPMFTLKNGNFPPFPLLLFPLRNNGKTPDFENLPGETVAEQRKFQEFDLRNHFL